MTETTLLGRMAVVPGDRRTALQKGAVVATSRGEGGSVYAYVECDDGEVVRASLSDRGFRLDPVQHPLVIAANGVLDALADHFDLTPEAVSDAGHELQRALALRGQLRSRKA